MSAPCKNIFEFLERQGWTFDYRRDGMIAPGGRFLPSSDIANLDPTFKEVYQQTPYAPGVSRAPGGPVASTRFVDPPPFPGKKWNVYEKLKMRLNLTVGDSFGLDYCHIWEGPNRTFCFVVKGDKALVLEDSPSLFPSDSFIGQFRLFQEVE
jgi:hypothetical protein